MPIHVLRIISITNIAYLINKLGHAMGLTMGLLDF